MGAWVPVPDRTRRGEPSGEPGSDERSTGASERAIQSRTAVDGTNTFEPNRPVDALRRPARRPSVASVASSSSSMEPGGGRTSRNIKSSASTSRNGQLDDAAAVSAVSDERSPAAAAAVRVVRPRLVLHQQPRERVEVVHGESLAELVLAAVSLDVRPVGRPRPFGR